MSIAGWHELGESIAKLVAQEPPFIQIMIILGGAFSAVMFLEGFRASFFPRREKPKVTAKEISLPPPEPSRVASVPRGPFLETAKLPRKPKRQAAVSAKPFRTPRPKIRRAPTIRLVSPPVPFNGANLPQVASFDD